MCGFYVICGYDDQAHGCMSAALDMMSSRGPDSRGTWKSNGISIGHNRLSILDLDVRADQPLESACGRYIIVYNGEIYNSCTLRSHLEFLGVNLSTTSDTEIILQLYVHYGVDMLSRLTGMFAFFIWDDVEKKGFAARDPYGIKPLYYSNIGDSIIFSSQVMPITLQPRISKEVNQAAISEFLMFGSVYEPNTIYRDIKQIRSGHYVKVIDNIVTKEMEWANITNSWSEAAKLPRKRNLLDSDLISVKNIIKKSVVRHMLSDVPVGILLSGGIDSILIAALMREHTNKKIFAITIHFDDFLSTSNDEVPRAALAAKHYNLTHHVRRVSREEFKTDMMEIISSIDQPSIDGVNTWYACKAAKELGLKVVLSGLGGDELLGGYSGFRSIPPLLKVNQYLVKIPLFESLTRILFKIFSLIKKNKRWALFPEGISNVMLAWVLYRSLLTPIEVNQGLLRAGLSPVAKKNLRDWVPPINFDDRGDPELALGVLESTGYMRNQLLRDADWASMAHSVELRVPFVDSLLLREMIPYLGLIKNKAALSSALDNPIPNEVLQHNKTGFSIPVSKWLTEIGFSESWSSLVLKRFLAAK